MSRLQTLFGSYNEPNNFSIRLTGSRYGQQAVDLAKT